MSVSFPTSIGAILGVMLYGMFVAIVIPQAIITGGTFIGTGAQGMAQSFSDSEQGVVAISVGNQSAGTKILLKDKSGKTIIEHSPELNFAVVILSSPDIKKGETYSITAGSALGEFKAS